MAEKKYEFKFLLAAAAAGSFTATFRGAGNEVLSLNKHLAENRKIFDALNASFKAGTISSTSYKNALSYINPEITKLNQAAEHAEKMLASTSKVMSGMKGLAKWGSFAYGIFQFTQNAIKFESAMADVKKVVDFDTPQQFKQMSKDILDMSTHIPMAAEGLAQIVAAGGQSGIAREELTKFAESAAKMGVAFDITADQAGEMMAKWRTAFKMNQDAVVELADKVNYLGNTTAASAPLISDVITRVGPLGEVGGVASGEIAALGASLVGSGINSEIAATGIKNMILGLTAGTSATKAQSTAFQRLGFDTVDLSKHMQRDARGAIISVLKAVQGLSKEEQASTLKEMFGKESLGAIAPLLSNLEGLEKNFKAVGDAIKYTGSMQSEFATRSATTENSLQLMNNRMDAAKISIANGLLPAITPLAELVGKLATGIGYVASEFPNFTTAAGIATIAVTSFYLSVNAYTALSGAVAVVKTATEGFIWFQKAQTLATAAMVLFKNTQIYSTIAQLAMNAAMYACPITFIASAFVIAAYEIWKNWDNVKGWFSAFFDWLAQKWEWVSSKLQAFSDWSKKPLFGGGDVKVGSNATGGIYGRGAFLTTFAEDSGESAIPHTPNRRNIGLLARTNEIMGNPLGAGGGITATFAPQITVSGSADVAQIDSIMQEKMREFEAMLQRVASQNRRLSYG